MSRASRTASSMNQSQHARGEGGPVAQGLPGRHETGKSTATEQTAFAENAVAYTATLNFLRGRVETVTRAIRGE